ncbi:transcription antitermination factor NusB [Psychrobacter sp. HD31]|uniref:transcription antitermination factor NusB n=1 Tax=Psychrobacter sp. HD31 TaxID=3112003 RepID=UPI003DA6661E
MKTPNTPTNTDNSRTAVIKTLINVQQGLSLSNMLDGLLAEVAENSKGFVHNLLLTSLRHWHATARLLDSLADKPIDEIEVRTTIQVGITQLIYLETADHASIFETVESVKQLGFERASGLVNAILRKVAKNPAKYRKACDKKHSLPNWLAKQLKQDWRDQYNELCKGIRVPAPMFLRVNARQSGLQDYAHKLQQTEIEHEILTLSTALNGLNDNQEAVISPIRLTQSQSISNLPNFDTGMVSVQDAHASIAGSMVKTIAQDMLANNPNNHLHILDACTAPSGKLAHCLELFDKTDITPVVAKKIGVDKTGNDKVKLIHSEAPSKLTFTAIDSEANRLERSKQTLARLALTDEALLICADATSWQADTENTEQFDVILLDAPCTATGVMRRHPDIGLLRQEDDVEQTVSLQKQILQNLWQQLKPNGVLIYATCSILKDENETQMLAFLADHSDANEVKINADWGIEQAVGRQCLPIDGDLNKSGGDGFYYAVLRKG